MGGSAIGGDLLKDWAKNKTLVPIEVNREYHLPAYANEKTLVFITSYSGDTEESLSAFLDALRQKCMIFCISSGGALLENAQRLKCRSCRFQAECLHVQRCRTCLCRCFCALKSSSLLRELLGAKGSFRFWGRLQRITRPIC